MSEAEKLENLSKFNAQRDITPKDKKNIQYEINFLHQKATEFETSSYWEDFAINCMFKKILFPEENDKILNANTYNAIEETSSIHFQTGNLGRHLNLSVAQKILFPQQWSKDPLGKEFYNDKYLWNILLENLEYINPGDNWDNIYSFFNFAQNMKILAPKKFEKVNLQEILGKNVWVEDIFDELKQSTTCYSNFTLLASPIQILGYPSKIEIEPLEWSEMEEEAQEIKKGDILHYLEFSARRKILAASDIKITDDKFDLIF